MKRSATVYVVDDDQGMRESLAAVLAAADFKTQIYDCAQAFLDDYQPSHPECMVLDLRMDGMDGEQLQEQLATRGVTTPILFLTGHGDVATAVRVVKSGAIDFMEKPADPKRLLERINAAIEQDTYQHEHDADLNEFKARCEKLSPREREVLGMVVEGQTSREIAATLCRSEKTIHLHRARMMNKLEVHNVAELVRLATQIDFTGQGAGSY